MTQITHLGTQTGYLQLPDVIAVSTTNITLLYLVGSIRHIPVFCPTHQAYHCIGVWASCTDPERSLLVFDASLEFSFGISEQYDEDMLEHWYDPDPEVDWMAFIASRAWQIEQGTAW